MVDQNPQQTFALVRADESTADITKIGRALAGPLGYKVADLVQVLSASRSARRTLAGALLFIGGEEVKL